MVTLFGFFHFDEKGISNGEITILKKENRHGKIYSRWQVDNTAE